MTLGPLGRLGRWTATHFRAVALAWLVVAVGLGVFAPRVEHALSGAGWEATGSESVQARELVDRSFQGQGSYGLMAVVHSGSKTRSDAAFTQTVTAVRSKLGADPAVTSLAPTLFSRDGNFVRYAIIDNSVFDLCETVCGGVRRRLDELNAVLEGVEVR